MGEAEPGAGAGAKPGPETETGPKTEPGPQTGTHLHADAGAATPTPPAAPRWHAQLPVLAVIALGGATGASARYAASLLWPTPAHAFPWTTFWVNVVGCAVIGVFMVVISDVWAAHRLVRPFFGTGVLGGFTTFSTYTVDLQKLLTAGQAGTALAYLALTALAALAAVWAAATATRRLVRRRVAA